MNMNMGGGKRRRRSQNSDWSIMQVIKGINDQLQMLDRVIQRVYPQCHKSYYCHYSNKIFDYLP